MNWPLTHLSFTFIIIYLQFCKRLFLPNVFGRNLSYVKINSFRKLSNTRISWGNIAYGNTNYGTYNFENDYTTKEVDVMSCELRYQLLSLPPLHLQPSDREPKFHPYLN